MSDLGTDLSFDDSVRVLGTYPIVDGFAGNTNVFHGHSPSTTHPAMTIVLPACDAAVISAGATGIFDGILILSMLYQESRLNPRAVTIGGKASKPVRGMAQFQYETGTKGVNPPIVDFYNPADAIEAAAKYLKYCWNQYASVSDKQRRLAYAVMGYNSGPGTTVQQHDSGTRFNIVKGTVTKVSTKTYAKDINTTYKAFAGLPALAQGPMKFV